MTKRVFIVHGWGGNPDEAWMPWLDRELTARGFQVHRLAMPHPDEPTIDDWVGTLVDAVGIPDADTHFVGHSIGCQTIMRYCAGLSESMRVGRVVCVAGFFTLSGTEEDPEDEVIRQAWLSAPLDTAHVHAVTERILGIFSDDDPVVPLENVEFFKDRLGAETVVDHGKGHYSEDSGVKELPVALDFLLR